MAVPGLTFCDGTSVPCLGLGTMQAPWSKSSEVEDVIKEAISLGYRHFDCALAYMNEKEIGEAIRESIRNNIVKREDLFITTKEGEEFFPKGEDGKPALSNIDFVDTWQAMQALVDKGLVKAIGVSNFNSKQIQRLLDLNLKHKPVTNQVEMNPFLRNEKLRDFCSKRGIILTAYAPLGSPNALSARIEEEVPKVLEEPVIKEIATRHGKSAGQVTLKWGLQRGYLVIPKTSSSQRLKENIDLFDFTLSEDEMEAINRLDKNLRLCRHGSIKENPFYPFNEEF